MKQYPRYFYICLTAFILACTVGFNWALSYQDLVPPGAQGTFDAWRPAIGIAVLGSAMVLNFVWLSIQIQTSIKTQGTDGDCSASIPRATNKALDTEPRAGRL